MKKKSTRLKILVAILLFLLISIGICVIWPFEVLEFGDKIGIWDIRM